MGQNSPNIALLRISPAARYALSAASRLALQPPGERARLDRIAVGDGLPPSFLAKILRALAKRRIVVSRRGRGGGHLLARPSGEITLGEIVAAVEAPRRKSRRCLLKLRSCAAGVPCVLHDPAAASEKKLWKVLSRTTLASYVRHQG